VGGRVLVEWARLIFFEFYGSFGCVKFGVWEFSGGFLLF